MYRKFILNTESYRKRVIEHPFIVILIVLIITGLCASGVRFLELSTDYRAFFSKDNPQLLAFESLQNIFSKNDNIFFVIRSKDDTVFTPETLMAIESLTESAWQIPFSTRVDSLTNFQHSSVDGDDLIVANLISDAANRSREELMLAKAISLSEPRLVNRIISTDAQTSAVNVTIQLPGKSRKEVPQAVAYARNLAGELTQKYPNLELYLTGNILLNNAMSESSVADIKSLVPAMYGVIIFTVLLLLRSIVATIIVLIIIGLSTITAAGLAGWVGIVITPPSASAPTIIMTLAVAGSIHVLMTLLASMRSGIGKKESIAESLKVNLEPVFLTSLTTAIGFFSMNFSDTPPLRDLGNISAMGIAAAFFYTIFLLPALVVLMPIRVKQRAQLSTRLFDWLSNVVITRYRFLLISMTVFAVIFILFVPRLELNDQYVNYFDETTRFRSDTDFAMEHLTGIYKIEYSLSAGESGGISNPEYLKTIEKFMQWYRSQPEVVHVNSIVETMKTLNRNMHGDNPEAYRLPENRNLAAQYLLLYEMSLPYGLDLNSQVSVDKDASRFTVVLKNIPTRQLLALEERAQHWLQNNAPASMITEGSGSSIIFAHMSARSIKSMIGGTILAMLLIGLVLMVAFKSYKYGLISFIPNMLPAIIAMGIWAVTVGELGFALSVMMAMTLGIVVDDTIHFLSKYIRARHEKALEPNDAVRYAFSSVGFALTTTTIVLVFGFLILAQSSFLPNSGMAMLTVITISIALIIDLLMVPPLLIWLEGRTQPERLTMQNS